MTRRIATAIVSTVGGFAVAVVVVLLAARAGDAAVTAAAEDLA